jgi:small subunit ribosomal protein S6
LRRPLQGVSASDDASLAIERGQSHGTGGSPVRNYEVAYIADPDLDEATLTALEEKVQGWITAEGGTVTKVDRWGRRKLAYPLRKRTDGHYVFIFAALPPQSGASVERNLRLSEQVLRFLITVQDEA